MKYIKLFMLLAVASLFAACSNDDEDINSATATISLSSPSITVKESAGYFNVPIKVTGKRNGDVKVIVSASPAATNGAVEDTNYLITDKTITIPATDSVANIQIKTVDDDVINDPRSFTVTITAEGATLGNSKTKVVLRDNDAAFYEKFMGKWKLTWQEEGDDGNPVDYGSEVTITGETNELAPNYNHILTCEAPKMFNIGIVLDCTWHFRYSFDKNTKTGTLGIIMGEQVASYGSSYKFIFLPNEGMDDVTATWALGDKDSFPTEITFPAGQKIYLCVGNSWYAAIFNLKLTKKIK